MSGTIKPSLYLWKSKSLWEREVFTTLTWRGLLFTPLTLVKSLDSILVKWVQMLIGKSRVQFQCIYCHTTYIWSRISKEFVWDLVQDSISVILRNVIQIQQALNKKIFVNKFKNTVPAEITGTWIVRLQVFRGWIWY